MERVSVTRVTMVAIPTIRPMVSGITRGAEPAIISRKLRDKGFKQEIFEKLDLAYVPPELREARGELELGAGTVRTLALDQLRHRLTDASGRRLRADRDDKAIRAEADADALADGVREFADWFRAMRAR